MNRGPNSQIAPRVGDEQRVLHTNAATAGVSKPAGAAASVFQMARPTRAPKCKQLDRATALQLEVHTGIPCPPEAPGRAGQSAYAALFARMPVGGMVVLPLRQARTFQAWARTSATGQIEIRRLPDERSDVRGVWRMPAPTTAPSISTTSKKARP